MYQGGVADRYISGFMNQVAQAADDAVTEELTNHLFAEPLKSFGTDLASLNMQRGRDHGVPSYNAYRGFCGLRRARQWNDLAGSFTNETLQKYSRTYATPDDIDLWSGGISERPMPGSMVGPVFGCIMGETFKNLRYGDRFWFENGGWPNSFTIGITKYTVINSVTHNSTFALILFEQIKSTRFEKLNYPDFSATTAIV